MFWPRRRLFPRVTLWKALRDCTLVVLCLAPLLVDAVDISDLHVSENGGVYHMRLSTVLDVPAEYVHRVLTDYAHIHRLHPAITQSDILDSPRRGIVRVKTRILDCISIFCLELDRVEDVHEVPPYDLQSVIVPSGSNFRSGKADWHIEEMEDRCQLVYEAQLEPDFIIVPVIGPYLVKGKLRDEMVSSLTRIECIAKIEQELDWNPHLRASTVEVDSLCSQPCESGRGRCPP